MILKSVLVFFLILLSACSTQPSDNQAGESDIEASEMMCGESINENEIDKLQLAIANAVNEADSLDNLTLWLQSIPCLNSVQLEEYVVKTFPPRREYIIEINFEGGRIDKKVLTIEETFDEQLNFLEIREP